MRCFSCLANLCRKREPSRRRQICLKLQRPSDTIVLEVESLEDRTLLSVAGDLETLLQTDERDVRDYLDVQVGPFSADLTRIGDSPFDLGNDVLQLGADLKQLDLDLITLATFGGGFIPSHGPVMFEGQGLAFFRIPGLIEDGFDPEANLGIPDVLLYKSVNPFVNSSLLNEPGRNALVTDPLYDPPYELVGWAYGLEYDPMRFPPGLERLPEDVLFVHESGHHVLHPLTILASGVPLGDMILLPPFPEDHHGSEPQGLPAPIIYPPPLFDLKFQDLPHPRLWDVHIFPDPLGNAPPQTGIVSPFESIPGLPTRFDTFFYPEVPFDLTPHSSDDRIQAEDFDYGVTIMDAAVTGQPAYGYQDLTSGNSTGEYRVTDVDISARGDASNGFAVFEIEAGEFLQYTVDVDQSGSYRVPMRMADLVSPGAAFHIEVDGADQTGSIGIPVLGRDFQFFCPDELLDLDAGEHQIRFVFDRNAANGEIGTFDYFRLCKPRVVDLDGDSNGSPRNDQFEIVRNPQQEDILDIINNSALINSIPVCCLGGVNIEGGEGNDRLILDTRPGPIAIPTVAINFDGGTGRDTVSLIDGGSSGKSTFTIQNSRVDGSAFGRLDFSSVESLNISGNNRANTFNINSVPATMSVTINGNGGSDTFNIGNGDFDTLIDGSVRLNGGSGRDIVRINDRNDGGDDAYTISNSTFAKPNFGTGRLSYSSISSIVLDANKRNNNITLTTTIRTTVFANDGNDTVRGGRGADFIDGGRGNDVLFGNDGNDTFVGGRGFDRSFGGRGNDMARRSVERFSGGLGRDGVEIEGTAGNDRIEIDFTRESGVPQLITIVNGDTAAMEYTGGETITVRALDGNDTVSASFEAGVRWEMEFFGGPGADILLGGQRDDLLDGGLGIDLLIGRGGDDQFLNGEIIPERIVTVTGGSGQSSFLAITQNPNRRFRVSSEFVVTPATGFFRNNSSGGAQVAALVDTEPNRPIPQNLNDFLRELPRIRQDLGTWTEELFGLSGSLPDLTDSFLDWPIDPEEREQASEAAIDLFWSGWGRTLIFGIPGDMLEFGSDLFETLPQESQETNPDVNPPNDEQ